MAATAKAIVGSVWLNQGQYEAAEAMAQETMAKQHSGLKIEGSSIKKSGSANVASVIGEAMSMIEESLKSNPSKPLSSYGDLEKRIAALEKENCDLRNRMSVLEQLVKPTKPESVASAAADTRRDCDEDDDDDFDLFGDDDDEAAIKLKEERIAAYQEKKAKKPALVAKSSIVLDVKPWDDETDMKEIEKYVRNIQKDGLDWKAAKLVPVGYGINKLRINCVVEDDKVSLDFLEEGITEFDLVQSVDVASFNKL